MERKFERIKHPFPRKRVVPMLGSPRAMSFDQEEKWEPDARDAFEQFKGQRTRKMLSPPLIQQFERPLRQQMKSQLDEQLKEIPSQKLALITKVVDGSHAYGSQHGGSSVLSSQPDLQRNQSIASIDPKQHMTKAEVDAHSAKYNLETNQVYEALSEFHAMSFGEPHLTFEMFFGQHALFRNKHPEMQRALLIAMGLTHTQTYMNFKLFLAVSSHLKYRSTTHAQAVDIWMRLLNPNKQRVINRASF